MNGISGRALCVLNRANYSSRLNAFDNVRKYRLFSTSNGNEGDAEVTKTYATNNKFKGANEKSRQLVSNPYKSRTSLSELEGDNSQIVGFGPKIFRINNTFVRNSVIVMKKSFLLWGAREFTDITTDSLALIPMLYPRPELLLLGTGKLLAGEHG
jgi:hypothetical protein